MSEETSQPDASQPDARPPDARPPDAGRPDARPPEGRVLPIVEETLAVGRRSVPTGRVRVSTVTETVEAVLEAVVATSDVEVTRVPVGREIETMPEVRTEGDVMIVPLVEEVPVVVTRLVLREEIHIKRRRGEKTLRMPVQLLKQRAEITREGRTTQGDLNMADSTYAAGARTLTAFFDSRADAEEAVTRLRALGLGDSEIRMTGGDEYAGRSYSDTDRGFWESISDFFFPPEDQATYAEGLRRGGYLVTVRDIPEARYDQVLDILDDEGSVDLEARAESWRSEGWTGAPTVTGGAAYAAGSEGGVADVSDTASLGEPPRAAHGGGTMSSAAGDASRTSELGDTEVIPVVREQLRVGKRDVDLGRVRVRSYVVEQPVSEDVTLHEERVEIERRPVDRAPGTAEAAFTDRTIEAEERAEEAVVSKEARVVEEIALRRQAEERTETVSDTVRRTEVEVEDERRGDRAGGTSTERGAGSSAEVGASPAPSGDGTKR